jgi:hypothetical protein
VRKDKSPLSVSNAFCEPHAPAPGSRGCKCGSAGKLMLHPSDATHADGNEYPHADSLTVRELETIAAHSDHLNMHAEHGYL